MDRALVDLSTEIGDETPAPVRLWQIDSSAVAGIGWFLVALAIISRGVVTAWGGFYWDDFTLQGRAARLPLDADFLIYSHDGHVMPAGALISWLTERAAPLEFWLPLLTMLALQAATAILGWLLLKRIFGCRPLVLIPTLIMLFSPMTLPGSVWWAAALNALPMQLGILAVTWGVWCIQREQRERFGRVWIFVGIVGSLLFFEKSLLIGLWLVLAMWLFGDDTKVTEFVKAQFRQRWVFWAVLAAIAAGYFVIYQVVSDRSSALPETFGSFLVALMTGIFVAVLPAMVGGPLDWTPIGFGSAIAAPPGWLVLLSLVVCAVLVRFAWRFSPRGVRAWIAMFGYVICVCTLMSITRLAATDPTVGMASMRYTADALIPLVLAVGITLMPIVGESDGRSMLALRNRIRDRLAATNLWLAAGALVAALIAVMSTSSFAAIWGSIPAKGWLGNARTTMAAGAAQGPILDQQVPEYVIWGLAYPYSNASWVLAPLPERPQFADYTNSPRYLNNKGKLVAGSVAGIGSKPGPTSCGWVSTNRAMTIELTNSTFEWEHRLQLDYIASAATAADVALATGERVRVTFDRGFHRMVATVEGGGETVTISGIDPGTTLCVGTAVVGTWQAEDPFAR